MAGKGGLRKKVPRMRTRLLDSLNNYEVETFLRRSDLIFIPVGTVEMHGMMPLGSEHVLPLAFAVKLAERLDGLVLPNLAYFFPGGTAIGRGTVSVSPSVGVAYLKEVCRSLLRQGFRRQVLLTAHGPALVTLLPVVRELFDETKCPIVYYDLCHAFQLAEDQEAEVDFDKLIWGAYHVLGRLDEVPTSMKPLKGGRAAYPAALAKLQRSRAYVGFYYSDVTHHGWWPARRMSAADREARAAEGARQIDRVIEAMKPEMIVDGIRELDRFVRKTVLPRYRNRLP